MTLFTSTLEQMAYLLLLLFLPPFWQRDATNSCFMAVQA